MFDLYRLGLSVTGDNLVNSVPRDVVEKMDYERHMRMIWIPILVAILAVILYFTFVHPKVMEKLAAKKEERRVRSAEKAEEHAAKKRDQELERLHRIKKQNKRK